MRRHWAEGAVEKLKQGQHVQLRPRGHSMTGRVRDGALVTIAPREGRSLQVDDIVLVEIQGRRYSHLVLHQILKCEDGKFLIGSYRGRINGWVTEQAIHGVAVQVEN